MMAYSTSNNHVLELDASSQQNYVHKKNDSIHSTYILRLKNHADHCTMRWNHFWRNGIVLIYVLKYFVNSRLMIGNLLGHWSNLLKQWKIRTIFETGCLFSLFYWRFLRSNTLYLCFRKRKCPKIRILLQKLI